MPERSCFNCHWYRPSILGGSINPPEPAECVRPRNEHCSTLPTFPFPSGCELWETSPLPSVPANHRGVVIFARVDRETRAVTYRIPFVVQGVVFTTYDAVRGYIDTWYAAGCPDMDLRRGEE